MINEIIKKNGITFGIIIGIIACLFQSITSILSGELYKNVFLGIIILVIYWLIRIYQAIITKKQSGNIISLKDCFTSLLISTTIGILISIVFSYFFYNHLSPELKPELNNYMNSKQLELYKAMGKSSSELNEILKNDNFSISNLIKGGLFSILISSIFNLLVSAFVKSKSLPQ
jgi:hypothetical protein